MPEYRAQKHHQDRMAETLREEISSMIVGELSDPRIRFAHVSEVALMPGGRSARVFVSVQGGTVEEEETLAGLIAARGHIRHELLERMGKRHVPEISFHIDRSKKVTTRIDSLMSRKQRKAKTEPTAATETTPTSKSTTPTPKPTKPTSKPAAKGTAS